jgi:hypothetical protein
VSIYNVKKFPGASPRTPIQRRRKGEEGRKLRRGDGMRWDGRGGNGSIPQIKFYDNSTDKKLLPEHLNRITFKYSSYNRDFS